MPFFDRLWWLRIVGAIAGVAFAIFFAAWLIFNRDIFLDWQWDTFAANFALTVLSAAWICLALLFPLWGLSAARTRHRQRRAALRGDRDAMPRAKPTPDSTNAPDVTLAPLDLWETPTSAERAGEALLYSVAALVFFGMFVGCAFLELWTLAQPVTRAPNQDWLAIATLITVLVTCLCFVVACAALAYICAVGAYWAITGKRYGLEASRDGILQWTQFGWRRFLPWDEMRLLEVYAIRSSGSSLSPRPQFRLYGRRAIIEWNPRGDYTYAGRHSDRANRELARRYDALLDLIAARTGLVPRTCDEQLRVERPNAAGDAEAIRARRAVAKRLRAERQNELRGVRKWLIERGGVVAGLSAALVITLFAGAIILAPLSPLPVLNWLVAISLVTSMLLIGVISLPQPRARLAPDAFLRDDVPLERLPTGYAYVYHSAGTTAWRRFVMLSAGVLLSVSLAAPLVELTHALSLDGELVSPFAFIASCLLTCIGVLGLLATAGAVRVRSVTVRADDTGLSVTGPQPRALLWSQIGDIEAHMRLGRTWTYLVQAAETETTISWSARRIPIHAQGARFGERDAVYISSGLLARIVSERSGVSIKEVDVTPR